MYMCLYLHVAKILTSPLLIQTFYSMCKGFLYSFLVREGIYYEKQIYEKIVIIVALTSIFAIPAPIAQTSHPTCVFAEQIPIILQVYKSSMQTFMTKKQVNF